MKLHLVIAFSMLNVIVYMDKLFLLYCLFLQVECFGEPLKSLLQDGSICVLLRIHLYHPFICMMGPFHVLERYLKYNMITTRIEIALYK